ncbi:MAG: hypothetical protein R3C26_01655 [Calditrichia bacterium]
MYEALNFLSINGVITYGGGNVTSIDTVYLAGGAPRTTPAMAWVWDLGTGDSVREALQMNDNGTNGDEFAGDDIWSITINFGVGAPKIFPGNMVLPDTTTKPVLHKTTMKMSLKLQPQIPVAYIRFSVKMGIIIILAA